MALDPTDIKARLYLIERAVAEYNLDIWHLI